MKILWRKAYEKFKDPKLLKIRLYDLRHWFATTTYMKTRDIFHEKYVLGHRNINKTMIYIPGQRFEYVTEMDNVKISGKRK
ncbi:site-specific integrase [Candidatus Bathyarchaeota archaeon]|nr:site-specific integrase [Candidatus Bathyarchaeota archaeon]